MLPEKVCFKRIYRPQSRRSFFTTVVGGFFGGAIFGLSLPKGTQVPSSLPEEHESKELEELVRKLGQLPPQELALFGPDLVQLSFSLPESEGIQRTLETLVRHLSEFPPQQARDLSSILLPALDRIGRKDLQAKALLFAVHHPRKKGGK